MTRSLAVALISAAVTGVSVLAVAAAAGAGLRIFHWASQRLARHRGAPATAAVRTPRLRMAREPALHRLRAAGARLSAAGGHAARNLTLPWRTAGAGGRGPMADRYARAAGQLGSGRLDVRVGGIYALERVAHDSPQHHPAVMDVLAAFAREHSRARRSPLARDGRPARHPGRTTPPDVQAAVTAIGRRGAGHDRQLVNLDRADLTGAHLARANLVYASLAYASLACADLAHADLTGADLTGADLAGADLTGAHLTGAILAGANLTRANLTRANLASEGRFGRAARAALLGADLAHADLTGAILKGADLTGANLPGADLTGADLTGAIFKDADLTRAKLTRANLTREDLTGAGLFRADLPGADLTGANLTGADLTRAGLTGADLTRAGLFDADLASANLTGTDLTGADLLGACWPPDAVIPAGWQRDTGSGRLRRPGHPLL
jgi:uncharacterized protein YjbI with pentapeptide repeats